MNKLEYINVLGTVYHIRWDVPSSDPDLTDKFAGRCLLNHKVILIGDFAARPDYDSVDIEKIVPLTVKHEVIHAFIHESGLSNAVTGKSEDRWSDNEECVDWFAHQMPKMQAIFDALGI